MEEVRNGGVAAALATLVIRLAVCGRNQLNPNMRTPRTCPPAFPSLPSLPPPPSLFFTYSPPLCNFPLQLVIASYIAYYPRTKRSFHSLLFPPLPPLPPLATLSLPCRICLKKMMMCSWLRYQIPAATAPHRVASSPSLPFNAPLISSGCAPSPPFVFLHSLFVPSLLALSLPSALCFVSCCVFGFNFSCGKIL